MEGQIKVYERLAMGSAALGFRSSITYREKIDVSDEIFERGMLEVFGIDLKIRHNDRVELRRENLATRKRSSVFGRAIGFTDNDRGFRFWWIKDGDKQVSVPRLTEVEIVKV